MTGTYEHSIDDKGRLVIPSKLRDELGEVFYVAPGVKRNLTLFPMAAWNELRARSASLTTINAADMDLFYGSSYRCEPDKQWRIQIPPDLRKYAGIDREIVTTGNNDRAQIWSADLWAARVNTELNPENIANILSSLGI